MKKQHRKKEDSKRKQKRNRVPETETIGDRIPSSLLKAIKNNFSKGDNQ